jgi:sphingomyelin phosphodiesterase acid-like 3
MASLSDIHFFPDYNTMGSKYCWPDEPSADIVANFGRFGCDSPEVLVRTVLSKMVEDQPNLDVLFLPGDVVAHHYNSSLDDHSSGKSYEKVLEITAQVAELIREYFPDTIVLPVIGNNDPKYHY